MRKNILKQIGILTALALFSLISWGTVASAVDLTVTSLHDSCNPDSGIHSYTAGTDVTCSVTSPVSGGTGIRYVYTGYTSTGSVFPSEGTDTDTTVSFDINVDSTITWNWKTQYQLTTHVLPLATGTIDPASDSWHDAGDITVTATPGSGYIFSEWTDNLSGTDNPATLNMNAPKTVTANFVSGWKLTVINPGDHDTPDPAVGVHPYTPGAPVTCSVDSPVDGEEGIQYVCTGWTGTGSVPISGGTNNTGEFTITQDSTITWNWKTQYQLTTVINPEGGGTITPASGSWHDAGNIEVEAAASSGYSFIDWGGDLSGSTNPDILTMDARKTVTANFGHTPPTGEVTDPGSDVVLDGCLDVFVDGDGTATPGPGTQDAILPDATLVYFKISDNVCWCDADGSNTWTTITGTEDSLWVDSNGNEKYDGGDTVIAGPTPVIGAPGMTLTSDYTFAYSDTIIGDENYDSGEDIYYEGGDGNWYLHYSPGEYTIEYNADDEDGGNLTLTLYADTNDDYSDGFAVTIYTHTHAVPTGDLTYNWDITDATVVPHGSYYICLKIDDGTSASPVYAYSDGKITINSYPNIKVSNPATDISVWENDYTINFVATDSDDNPPITLYYDDDDNYSNGFIDQIAGGLHKTDTSCVWDISSVPKDKDIHYYICAIIPDLHGRTPYYSYSKACVTCIEEPVLKLSVTSTHTTIDLDWTDLTPSLGSPDTLELYRAIYRNGSLGSYVEHPLSPSDISYQDTAYPPEGGTTNYEDRIYYYVIASYTGDEYGPFTSNTVNEMLVPFPPEDKPTNLSAVTGIGVVSLSWDDNSTDETGFYIERKKKGIDYSYSQIGTATTGSTNYDDRTITAGESYYYRIKTYKTYPDTGNTKDANEYSNEAFIDTLPPIGGLLGKEGGGTGCFIATAAYGTPMAKEVRSLCEFRDNVLLKTTAGKSFVEFYYKTSPPIAGYIRNRPVLKAMVRIGLKPLVWFSKAVTSKN